MLVTSIPDWINALTGRTQDHVVEYLPGICMSEQTRREYVLLKTKALSFNLHLDIVSSFRSYQRQVDIWNRKVQSGLQKNIPPEELIHQILRWSALPGTSRHHWGTDIDVYDSSKLDKNLVKLEPHEYEAGGPFEQLTAFLNQEMSHFGFYRPYDKDRNGVAPELWHISFEEESRSHFDQYTFDVYQLNLENSSLLLKELLLEKAEELYERYFMNVG
jgi:hypothetical protein